MKNVLRELALTEEFDYNFAISALSMYKHPRVKINDLLKKGHIIRVKKGLYVFGPELSRGPYVKETLANLIYGPSYISLEYALSFYGMIPEKVETVTSITGKRNKLFRTPIGTFSYKYINSVLLPHATTLYQIDDRHTVLIATREKALCDMLYFVKKIGGVHGVRDFIIKDLRVDMNDLKGLRISVVKELAGLYGHNAKLLYDTLEDMV